MGSRRLTDEEHLEPRLAPPTTEQERENHLINLAMDRAESQLRDGSASAQVITYYLKLGSSREKLEQERLKNENTLLQIKAEAIASEKRTEVLVEEALKAFRSYAGVEDSPEDHEDELGPDEEFFDARY